MSVRSRYLIATSRTFYIACLYVRTLKTTYVSTMRKFEVKSDHYEEWYLIGC